MKTDTLPKVKSSVTTSIIALTLAALFYGGLGAGTRAPFGQGNTSSGAATGVADFTLTQAAASESMYSPSGLDSRSALLAVAEKEMTGKAVDNSDVEQRPEMSVSGGQIGKSYHGGAASYIAMRVMKDTGGGQIG